jgi:hypothetical protein
VEDEVTNVKRARNGKKRERKKKARVAKAKGRGNGMEQKWECE